MSRNYLLAVVPPKDVAHKADEYRQLYAKYTTYQLPPHITIYPPFLLSNIDEKQLKNLLNSALSGIKSNAVKIDSFGYFTGKNNVAYFKPNAKSQKYLKSILAKIAPVLKGNIKNAYEDYKITLRKYSPHMTIAEKIPDDILPKIKENLRLNKVNFQFKLASINLFMQRLSSNKWVQIAVIKF